MLHESVNTVITGGFTHLRFAVSGKGEYLKEQLRKGQIIDFHSHILPGMDDGSKSLNMSKELILNTKKQGVDILCLSPHYYPYDESIATFLQRRDKAWLSLRMLKEAEDLTYYLGAEIAYTDSVLKDPQLGKLSLQKDNLFTNVLLLEMPMTRWQAYQIEEITDFILQNQYKVILVHPERFLFEESNLKYLEKLSFKSVFALSLFHFCVLSTVRTFPSLSVLLNSKPVLPSLILNISH